MEEIVIGACKNIFNDIAADIKKKALLKDEQYFQGEIYLDLQQKVLELNDEWTVKMGYSPSQLQTGKIDISVLDHRKRSLMLLEVIRGTTETKPKSLVHKLIRLATLVSWNHKADATGMVILVGDSRDLAELYIADKTALYQKRKIVDLDKLQVTKDATNNFEKYMKNLEEDLCLKPPNGENISQNITVEFLKQFSTLRAVKDEDKFAVTVWRIRANNNKAFITEIEKETVDKSLVVTEQKYKLYNRKWESRPFRLSNRDQVYFYDELCIGQD